MPKRRRYSFAPPRLVKAPEILRCSGVAPDERRLVRRRGCPTLKPIMSSASKRIFLSARLPGFTGRGDKYLGEIAQELRRVLLKTQNTFVYPSCRLPDAAWSDVAALLVEWAEDVHNDIGLWRAVETHQRRCFDTPLPLIVNEASSEER